MLRKVVKTVAETVTGKSLTDKLIDARQALADAEAVQGDAALTAEESPSVANTERLSQATRAVAAAEQRVKELVAANTQAAERAAKAAQDETAKAEAEKRRQVDAAFATLAAAGKAADEAESNYAKAIHDVFKAKDTLAALIGLDAIVSPWVASTLRLQSSLETKIGALSGDVRAEWALGQQRSSWTGYLPNPDNSGWLRKQKVRS